MLCDYFYLYSLIIIVKNNILPVDLHSTQKKIMLVPSPLCILQNSIQIESQINQILSNLSDVKVNSAKQSK